MDVIILGAGALGAYLGGRLQQSGQNVSFLVRQKRAQQLHEHGLKINSIKGDYHVQPLTIFEDVKDIEKVDLVVVAVKGYHLQGAIPQLRELVKKGAKVLPVLNGLEHIEILQKEFGAENVIGGLIFIIATLNEIGHVVHTSEQHHFLFGPLHDSQQEICLELHKLTSNANIGGYLSENILEELWNKYMFITAFSGITTAGNIPIGIVRQHKETLQVVKQILIEMKTLANAYHVPLTDQHVDKGMQQINMLSDEATSSMHQDRRKRLPLEVEHLQGGALRMAKKVGLQLSVIETLYGLIKPFENQSRGTRK